MFRAWLGGGCWAEAAGVVFNTTQNTKTHETRKVVVSNIMACLVHVCELFLPFVVARYTSRLGIDLRKARAVTEAV